MGSLRYWISRHRVLASVLAVALVVIGIGAAFADDEPTDPQGPVVYVDDRGNVVAQPDDAVQPDGAQPDDAVVQPDDAETAELQAAAEGEPSPTGEQAATYVVSRVVDGDTIDLVSGERVRLVGIDTPEHGECGFERAADALARMVEGRRVVLSMSDEDQDRYGRLLRYVDVAGRDAGLQLIRQGLAIARYDSRDGYGRHPREERYIRADRRRGPVKCAAPRPFAGNGNLGDSKPGDSNPGNPGGCAPGYDPCVPSYPPDLNCADTGPVTVTGPDPHGLDADHDGRACGGD